MLKAILIVWVVLGTYATAHASNDPTDLQALVAAAKAKDYSCTLFDGKSKAVCYREDKRWKFGLSMSVFLQSSQLLNYCRYDLSIPQNAAPSRDVYNRMVELSKYRILSDSHGSWEECAYGSTLRSMPTREIVDIAYTRCRQMLAPLLKSGGPIRRILRAGFELNTTEDWGATLQCRNTIIPQRGVLTLLPHNPTLWPSTLKTLTPYISAYLNKPASWVHSKIKECVAKILAAVANPELSDVITLKNISNTQFEGLTIKSAEMFCDYNDNGIIAVVVALNFNL